MRWPSWLRWRKAAGAVIDTASTQDARIAGWVGGGMDTRAGISVNGDRALRQVTWYTCVRIIAETLGSLPAAIYERRGDNAVKVDHDLGAVLFSTPNADMDRVNFIEALGTNLAGQGNSYALINGRPGAITSLYPIPSNRCDPVRDSTTDYELKYRVNDRGRYETYPREKIWQTRGFGDNGLVGFSPIGYQRELIGMALATEDWQSLFFANGAAPSFFVKIAQFLNPEQRIKAQQALESMFGLRGAYKPLLLEGGMEVTPNTMPLKDAQFLELRQATRHDIFGMYRIPPHMGGDLSRSTNNNIEQQALEFVKYALIPYLTRLEASASRWLMTPAERRRFFIKWNVEGLLRADSAARAALYAVMLANGVMSRNEVRALEDLNPSASPGMNDYTVQLAMTPIQLLAASTQATIDVANADAKRTAAAPAPSGVASEPKALADLINVSVEMPESVKHEFAHHLPGVLEMLDVMREANVLNTKGSIEVRDAVAALTEQLRSSKNATEDAMRALSEKMAAVHDAQFFDREAEVDGVKVRSRIVQPLRRAS